MSVATILYGNQEVPFRLVSGHLHLPTIADRLGLENILLDGAVSTVDREGFTYETFETGRRINVTGDPLPDAAAGPGPGSVGAGGEIGALRERLSELELKFTKGQELELREQLSELELKVTKGQQVVSKLQLQVAKASRTTHGLRDIGRVFLAEAATIDVANFHWLISITEDDPRVSQAEKAVLAKFRAGTTEPSKKGAKRGIHDVNTDETVPTTLADLFGCEPNCEEVEEMQPAMMKLLRAAAEAVTCDAYLADTHSRQLQFTNPRVKPDCVTLPSESSIASWPQVVVVWEFKVGVDIRSHTEMVGQLVQRCSAVLEAQPSRRHALGVGITMQTIEAFMFTMDRPFGQVKMTCTGPLPFSVSPAGNAGFGLLVRVLATPMMDLGYLPPELPGLESIGGYQLDNWQLLRQGSEDSSFIYVIDLHGDKSGRGVVKLNRKKAEGDILEALSDAPNTIRLLGRTLCDFQGLRWEAILLWPFVEHLSAAHGLGVVAQVVYDVAGAIKAAEAHGILHRDITPGNFGQINGRGWLIDFSAAIVRADRVSPAGATCAVGRMSITGTLRWMPYSALDGRPHTVSSQLEGLFISLVDVCCDGKLGTVYEETVDGYMALQLGLFAGEQGISRKLSIAPELGPLVSELHDLFWPRHQQQGVPRSYSRDVTVEQVQQVCKHHGAQDLAGA